MYLLYYIYRGIYNEGLVTEDNYYKKCEGPKTPWQYC